MPRPQVGDFSTFYQNYINNATGETIADVVASHAQVLFDFVQALPEEKANYAYAEGKWTVKQLLQHMIDTERVFTYRLTSLSRKEQVSLPGFDENWYADNATAAHRDVKDLKQEFLLLRQSTDLFVLSLAVDQLQYKGVASSHPITANALAFIIYGHNLHHKKILEERYL